MGRRKRKKFKQLKKLKFKLNPTLVWFGVFFLIFVILFGGLGYAIYNSNIFKVQPEDINSSLKLDKKLLRMVEDKSLFSLNIKEIADYILKTHPEYKQVFVLKRFPSGLDIKVIKRIAYAQIKGRKFFLLDKEGVIFNDGLPKPAEGLITIEINSDWRLFRKGYRVSKRDIAYSFELISKLAESDFLNMFKISSINSTQPEALYFMIDLSPKAVNKKIRVIIGKNNFSKKISLLEDVINTKFKDKLNLIQYIDLRYKEVYVGLDR